jgi:hypothetical protein
LGERQKSVTRGAAAHRRSFLACERRRPDDGAGTLDDAGDQPSQRGESEEHGEGDAERQEQRPADPPLGVGKRTDHAGVDRRAVDSHRPNRILDDRTRDVALGGADHFVAPEGGLRLTHLGHQGGRLRVEAGADQVLLALLEELGVDAEANVDDTVVGIPLDGPGPRLVDLEPAGLERRVLRRSRRCPGLQQRADEHDLRQRRRLASRRHGDQPSPPVRGRRRRRRRLLGVGGSGDDDGGDQRDSGRGGAAAR